MPYYYPYFFFIAVPILMTGLYFQFEKHFTKQWMRWVWWGGCAAALLLLGWYASQELYIYDFFKGYYHGGRKIINNLNDLYDENCYNFTNFPLVAHLFAPLASLPKESAGRVFFLLNFIFILPLAYWLIKFADLQKTQHRWFLIFLLVFNGPLDYNMWLGNITQIITLGLLVALWWVKTGHEWLAGILFGINGLLKIPLILPAGYFFVQRRWRVVGGGLLVFVIVLTASLIVIPSWLNIMWADRCILAMAGNPITAYNNQSVHGFLGRLFIPDYIGWHPIAPTFQYKLASSIAQVILYAPVVFILFTGLKRRASPNTLISEFLILLTCSLLTSPISWTHYLLMLMIPIAHHLKGDEAHPKAAWQTILLGISVLLLSIPINSTQALFERTGQVFFLSLHFYGAFFLYVFLLLAWFQNYRNINASKEG